MDIDTLISKYINKGYKYLGKDLINQEEENYSYPVYNIIYKEQVQELLSVSYNEYFLFFWKEDKSTYCLECNEELIVDGKYFRCKDCCILINIREYFKMKFRRENENKS